MKRESGILQCACHLKNDFYSTRAYRRISEEVCMATKKKGEMDERVENFAEEIGQLGKNVGRHAHKHAKTFERHMKTVGEELDTKGKQMEGWYHRTFGVLGPLISSIIGIIILGAIIWILLLLGTKTNGTVFSELSSFLRAHIALLFGFSLLFSYTEYGNKVYPKYFRWVNPITTAAGIVVALWLVINILYILMPDLQIPFLTPVATAILTNMVIVFLCIVIVGYVVLLLLISTKPIVQEAVKSSRAQKKPPTSNPKEETYKRLYRSGNERILGGVCGGIAEYFNVDPVLIRLLWIIGLFVSVGTLILAYFIFWIIIPRNPHHAW